MTAAPPSTFGRGVRRLTATVTTGAALAACAAVPVTGSAAPSPDVAPTSGAVSLAGWRLTLPQAGKKGAADVVDPAAATPPWLGTDAGRVALRSRFAFGITDDGNGNLTFTARDGTRHATADAAVPTAFQGAPVRFQAGAYQQGRAGGTSGDGARLTFAALATAAR